MDALKSAVVDTRASFDIQNDLKLLDNISRNLQQLDSLQGSDLKEKRDRLMVSFYTKFYCKIKVHKDKTNIGTDLKKQLNTLSNTINELKLSPKLRNAKNDLIELENQMFKIANSLTKLNMEINSLKLTYNQDIKQLDDLEEQIQNLKVGFKLKLAENSSSELGEASEKAKLIKLRLYESLGLKIDPENKEILVLNKQENKTSVLKVDDSYSEYFISNYIWNNI